MVAVGYTLMCEQTAPTQLVDAHVQAIKKFADAGFTHVALVQVGGGSQPEFLDWAGEQLLPPLREL